MTTARHTWAWIPRTRTEWHRLACRIGDLVELLVSLIAVAITLAMAVVSVLIVVWLLMVIPWVWLIPASIAVLALFVWRLTVARDRLILIVEEIEQHEQENPS